MMTRSTARFAIPIQLLVLLTYAWYFTTGYWTHLPDLFSWNLYDRLANAFAKGQFYLEEAPAADLLALPDPYVIQARKFVSSYIGDATLYQGRYYLYWGPVPGALLAILKVGGYRAAIPDATIVMVSVSGLFVVLSALIRIVWKDHFAHLPPWTYLASLPVVGLGPPFAWVLNNPLVYEGALAAASFFFMAGLLMSYVALSRPALRPGLLLLTGAAWALAIGCQFTQVIGVAVAVALLILRITVGPKSSGTPIRVLSCAAVSVPILAMLTALGWYNFARFGSVLEFGYRYQLAVVNLHEHYREIFRPIFAVPNAYNYMVNAPLVSSSFPFIVPQYGSLFSALPVSIPSLYYSEAITGLVYSAPILVLAAVPLALALRRLPRAPLRSQIASSLQSPLHWLLFTFASALIPNIAVLLFFYYSAPRYLMAVMPLLLILSVIGFWLSYSRLQNRPGARRLLVILSATLAAVTIIMSTLLAISSSQDRFVQGNPALIESINRFLGGK